MQQVRKLTLAQVRSLYAERLTEDFPPGELKPLIAIEAALALRRYACFGYCDGDAILAYAFFVKRDRWMLLDYYAVRRDVRNQGLGSRFLQALIAGPLRDCDVVLVEVDDPDSAADAQERKHRIRRKRFYLQNGLWDTGVRATTFGVEFQILALHAGESPDARDVRDIYSALYHAMLPDRIYNKWVKI